MRDTIDLTRFEVTTSHTHSLATRHATDKRQAHDSPTRPSHFQDSRSIRGKASMTLEIVFFLASSRRQPIESLAETSFRDRDELRQSRVIRAKPPRYRTFSSASPSIVWSLPYGTLGMLGTTFLLYYFSYYCRCLSLFVTAVAAPLINPPISGRTYAVHEEQRLRTREELLTTPPEPPPAPSAKSSLDKPLHQIRDHSQAQCNVPITVFVVLFEHIRHALQ